MLGDLLTADTSSFFRTHLCLRRPTLTVVFQISSPPLPVSTLLFAGALFGRSPCFIVLLRLCLETMQNGIVRKPFFHGQVVLVSSLFVLHAYSFMLDTLENNKAKDCTIPTNRNALSNGIFLPSFTLTCTESHLQAHKASVWHALTPSARAFRASSTVLDNSTGHRTRCRVNHLSHTPSHRARSPK